MPRRRRRGGGGGHPDRRSRRSSIGAASPRLFSRPACRSPIPSRTGRCSAPQAAGIEIIGDIELFCRERRAARAGGAFVAITGTNGKSTTTALIGHSSSRPAATCSSAAISARASCRSTRRGRAASMSSSARPSRSTLRRASTRRRHPPQHHAGPSRPPRHHGELRRRSRSGSSPQATTRAHRRRRRMVPSDRRPAGAGAAAGLRVSARRPLADGVYARDGAHLLGDQRALGRDRSLAGSARSAALTMRRMPPRPSRRREARPRRRRRSPRGCESFPGLPHRMEEVGRRGRVLFVNDSKATNADAAAKALATFDRSTGSPAAAQKGGIASLAEFFPSIAQGLSDRRGGGGFRGDAWRDRAASRCPARLRSRGSGGGRAMRRRREAEEAVVLLSPACASFDQFQNFEGAAMPSARSSVQLDGIHSREEASMMVEPRRPQPSSPSGGGPSTSCCCAALLALMLGGRPVACRRARRSPSASAMTASISSAPHRLPRAGAGGVDRDLVPHRRGRRGGRR